MNLQVEKQSIIRRVAQVENADLIQAIKSLLDYSDHQEGVALGYLSDGTPVTRHVLESRIEAAEQEIENGQYLTVDQLEEEFIRLL